MTRHAPPDCGIEAHRSKAEAAGSQVAVLNLRFARNLVLLRRAANLSQGKTAERASLHRTQVSQLERGLRLPQLDTIVKLGGAIEVEPCELLTGMEWRLGSHVQRSGTYARGGSGELAAAEHPEVP